MAQIFCEKIEHCLYEFWYLNLVILAFGKFLGVSLSSIVRVFRFHGRTPQPVEIHIGRFWLPWTRLAAIRCGGTKLVPAIRVVRRAGGSLEGKENFRLGGENQDGKGCLPDDRSRAKMTMAGKNYLVTGGAGFVGSVLSHRLTASGQNVTVADDLSNGSRENLPKEARFLEMDLADQTGYRRLDEGHFDAVIHCAAQSSNAISFKDPQADLSANQVATLSLLEFCRRRGIRRFLFTSSMSVYGRPTNFPTPETESCYPDSFYAVHKLASEHYVRIYAQEYGLEPTVFRLYTTYGYGQNLANLQQGLLSIYLGYLLNNAPLVVKGSGERLRDIVHVEDVVDAIMLSLHNPATIGKTYNLGTGESLTIHAILRDLLTGLSRDPDSYPIRWEPSTPGDPPVTHASIQDIARDTGWRPKIGAQEGIRRTLERYRTTKRTTVKK